MTKEEFIEWLKTTSFEKRFEKNDSEWRELMDYADYIWDDLTIEEDRVVFGWDYMYWGGSEYKTKEFTFEDFIKAYKNDTIKY